jgi:hypothetical protein
MWQARKNKGRLNWFGLQDDRPNSLLAGLPVHCTLHHLTEINEVANVIPVKRYHVYIFYTLTQPLKANLGSERR